jgi:hypothetical protein
MSRQDYCHPFPLPSLFLLRAPSNQFATSIGTLCDCCYSAINLPITATSLSHLYFRSFYCFVGPFLLFLFSLRSKPTIKQLSIITMSGRYYSSSLLYSVFKIGPCWSAIMLYRVMLFPVGLCRNVLSTRRFSKISWY